MTEPNYKGVGKSLLAFTKSLLDHRANNAKTSREEVQSRLDQWRSTVREREEDMNYLQQRYDTKHGVPRAEATGAYEQYQQQQQLARTTFLETRRRDDLYKWLENRFDERHFTALTDPIYTKYVHDL